MKAEQESTLSSEPGNFGGRSTHFLSGGGRMGALMRTHDWSRSPLGDPAGWPDVLKIAVATCLGSRFPMVVWWSKELIMLYTKHPQGMGRPGRESWPETWPIVGKQFEDALNGTANWAEDLLLASDRQGYMQECYFTYSHSPLRDASGEVAGVMSTVHETTSHVLSKRRLGLLRELSDLTVNAAAELRSVDETCRCLIEKLCSNNPDVPFALLYLNDKSRRAELVSSSGVDTALFPAVVDKDDVDSWGIGRVLRGLAPSIASEASGAGTPLPGGVWPEPTKELMTLALRRSDRQQPFGAVLVGVNPRLRLDDDLVGFLKLVASQITSALSALQAVHDEKEGARLKELLINELQHRTRNLLTIVQAISDQTRSASRSLEDYARDFNGRLGALGRVQNLLSSAENESVMLGDVARLQLAALPPNALDRISLDGPAAALPRESVQLLSLALYELVTNALKHGALNGPAGTIVIRWKVHEPDTIGPQIAKFEWIEKATRIEKRAAPSRRGFGRVLLEEALPRQLGAKTYYRFTADGVHCAIDLPLSDNSVPVLDGSASA